jgi:hypothetical protein
MPSRSRSAVAWRSVLTLSFLGVISCLDKQAPTESVAAARFELHLSALFTRSGATTPPPTLVMTASYLRPNNARIILAEQTIAAASDTQQIRFLVDLKSCLSDLANAGATTCPLRVMIKFRDSTSQSAIDSTEFGPLAAVPGASFALAATFGPVTPVVRSVTVRPSGSIVNVGSTVQLVATVDADPRADTSVSWASSNTSVVTVTTSGFVTAVGAGAASIVARSIANPNVAGAATFTVLSVSPPQLTISGVSDANGVPVNFQAIKGTVTVSVIGTVSQSNLATIRLRVTSGGATTTVATAPAGLGVVAPVKLPMNSAAYPNGPVSLFVEGLSATGQVLGTSPLLNGTISNP